MHESVLRELFDYGLYPSDKVSPNSPEYREVMSKLSGEIAHFKEILSPDEQKRLDEMENIYYRVVSLNNYEWFAYGFKLAISLLSEAFTGVDKLPHGE